MAKQKKLFTLFILVITITCFSTGCQFRNRNTNNSNNNEPSKNNNPYIIENKVVDEFQFSNASLVYEKSTSTFTIEITNTSDQSIMVKNVVMYFYDPEGNQLAKLTGHVGENIAAHDTKKLVANHYESLLDSYSIEYIIEK